MSLPQRRRCIWHGIISVRPRWTSFRRIFTDFLELHGDRLFADDLAIVGGLAKLNGVPVTVIGHQRGKDTKDNIARFFGSPHPEGFRKALRLMQQADKFHRPIITFIDTKGAYPGNTAEERGQSEAIARNLREMATFGRAGHLRRYWRRRKRRRFGAWSRQSSADAGERHLFRHLSQRSGSIFWKDASKADQAAEAMKITATDLLEMEVIEEVMPEPKGGAHRDAAAQSELIKEAIWRHLQELSVMTPQELIEDRYLKFRKIGRFAFAPSAQGAEPIQSGEAEPTSSNDGILTDDCPGSSGGHLLQSPLPNRRMH